MVLMIYNEQICKEILMPNLFNTDYQIRLSAGDYRLREDIDLQLERGGREWTLVSTQNYWITEGGEKKASFIGGQKALFSTMCSASAERDMPFGRDVWLRQGMRAFGA